MTKLLRLFTVTIFASTCMVSMSLAQDLKSKMVKLLPEVYKVVDEDAERLKEIFKDIHQHVELGFMETRMAAIVAKELQALDFELKTGIGRTGVVGILNVSLAKTS